MKEKYSSGHILSEINPPANLKGDILLRIKIEQEKASFRKKMLLQCCFFVSSLSLIAALGIFGKDIASSDFWSVSSLGITDMKIVTIYWQEFALSLLETFPLAEFICVMVPIFILLVLAKQYASQQLMEFKLK